MRSLLIVLFIFGIATSLSAQRAKNFKAPDFIPEDPASVSTPFKITPSKVQAVPIPTLRPSDEAKILVWWPDTDIDYKMPNLLSPKHAAGNILHWRRNAQDEPNH